MAASTKPTKRGLLDVSAECECGWTCTARNAQAVAALHHARCGQRTRCETTFVLVWDAVPARQQP